MSRTRRILGGTVIAYGHQAAIILVGLWLTPFLLQRVGQRELGLWLVAGQVLGYLALLDLGVVAILPREVAFASGQGDAVQSDEQIGSLVARVRAIVRWQTVGLSLACGLVWWFLPGEWLPLKWPIGVVFAVFVLLYPSRVAVAALQGLQDLPFLAKTQIAGWAVSTIVTVALVLAGAGLYALVVGWGVSMAIPAGAAVWRVYGRWPRMPAAHQQQNVKKYFERSVWVSVGQVAQVLLNGSDVLLLARLLGPAAVVPYACTGKLVTVFTNHPQLLMHAAQPALSELRASGSRDKLAKVATALTQAMLMMSGALVVLILPVNHFFVNWWVGPGQYGGWGLTVAFTAMMLLRHWNVAIVYTLFCFGYERQLSLCGLIDGLVTVVLTGVFVWKWGPIGAPLASVAGVSIVSLPINARSVAHELDLTVRAFIWTISPLFIRIVAIAVTAGVASRWTGAQSLASVALVTAAVAVLYAAAILPMAWKGPLRPYLRLALPMLGWKEPARAL